MANLIPPLVCSTPPPIDDFEEPSQGDDSADIDFADYETNTDVENNAFEGPSLPNTPRHVSIIKEDHCVNENLAKFDNKIEAIGESEVLTFEKLDALPLETVHEKNESESEKSINEEKTVENIKGKNVRENDENQIDEIESDEFNFISQKLDSPPSLELTFQVISDENDSFEKLSNDEKDKIKESYDIPLESNLENVPKDEFESLPRMKDSQQNEPEFANFLKADNGVIFENDFKLRNTIESENVKTEDCKLGFDDLLEAESIEIAEKEIRLDPEADLRENKEIRLNFNSSLAHDLIAETFLEIKDDKINNHSASIFPEDSKNKFPHIFNSEDFENKIDGDDGFLTSIKPENNSTKGCDLKSSDFSEANYVPQENFVFEADFSQFESCEPEIIEPKINDFVLNTTLTETVLDDCIFTNNDDFDSFQDFEQINIDKEETFENSCNNNKNDLKIVNDNNSKVNKLSVNETDNNSDFDDEFGDFSDFKEAPPIAESAIQISVTEDIGFTSNTPTYKQDKFLSILNVMFPKSEKCDKVSDVQNQESFNELIQTHRVQTNLNHIDSANALDYQWINSNTRHSLIRSLGIDARNILYGEKWNSSMPRFAANLGFTPLEPLKPIKLDNSGTPQSNSAMANVSSVNNLGVSKTNSVPEAEFDWSSSGLVNPLDASHAHTLLLDYDLDQLVVVANLDNIKLDSYSSYLYPSSSSSVSSISTSSSKSSALKLKSSGTTTTTTNVQWSSMRTEMLTPTIISTKNASSCMEKSTKKSTTKPTMNELFTSHEMKLIDNRWASINFNKICNDTTTILPTNSTSITSTTSTTTKYDKNTNSFGNGTIYNFSNLTNFNSQNSNENLMQYDHTLNDMHHLPHPHRDHETDENLKLNTNKNATMNATNLTTVDTIYDIMLGYSLSSRSKKSAEEKSNIQIHTPTDQFGQTYPSDESTQVENRSIEANVSTEYESGTKKSKESEFVVDDGIDDFDQKHTPEHLSTSKISKLSAEQPNDADDTSTSKISSIDNELSQSISKISTSFGTETLSSVDIGLELPKPMHLDSETILPNITSQTSYNENRNNICNDSYLKQHSTYPNDYINMGPSSTAFVVQLKETHIFTPTKSENPISQSINDGGDFATTTSSITTTPSIVRSSSINNGSSGVMNSIDFDYETAAAGTIINEKVIKKEYHDVEYDPSKFGLSSLELNPLDNVLTTDTIGDNKLNDITCLNSENYNSKTKSNLTSNWSFHLNDLNNEIKSIEENAKNKRNATDFVNTNNAPEISSNIFGSNNSNESHQKNQNLGLDFETAENFKVISKGSMAEAFDNGHHKTDCPNPISTSTCRGSFDDEFTDFQSVLPSKPTTFQTYTAKKKDSPSKTNVIKDDKIFPPSPVLAQKLLRDTSRNHTPTLPPDDRMILSPAILLPQSVVVNHSGSIPTQGPKIDWPEPGINSDELARLESIYPQNKSIPIANVQKIDTEDNHNINNINDDDWSDFMSVPPAPQKSIPLQQSSPSIRSNSSNLNIIYNPQSPTKVSTQHSGNHQQQHHINKSLEEDEWSDFISSTPNSIAAATSSNIGTNYGVIQSANAVRARNSKDGQWNLNPNPQFVANDYSSNQHPAYLNQNQKYVPNQQQGFANNNNNNKISQYLLNNSATEHRNNHINNGTNIMQLNSLKPTDFIPHHHTQHQLQQKQQKILSQSSNNSGAGTIGSSNNISFIPDLGFSAPQNQFINITKKGYQRK